MNVSAEQMFQLRAVPLVYTSLFDLMPLLQLELFINRPVAKELIEVLIVVTS